LINFDKERVAIVVQQQKQVQPTMKDKENGPCQLTGASS
jgi:hypothetical protein